MEEKDYSRPVFLRKPGKPCDVTMAVPLSSLSLCVCECVQNGIFFLNGFVLVNGDMKICLANLP